MGGAQYQAKLLTDYLLQLGNFEIHYLARRVNADFHPVGYKVHKIGNSKGAGFLFDTRRLLRVLSSIKPDSIYQHVGCAYTGVAAYYCKKHDCKLVWHIASDIDVERASWSIPAHFSLKYLDKVILEYGLKHAQSIVGQTEHQSVLIQKNYKRGLTDLVRNFHPLPSEALDKKPPIKILWVANLKVIKQPEIFIQLARALSHLDAQFIIMGGLQGEDAWRKETMAEIESTPNIQYLGSLSQEAVNQHFATSHLLVNTSRFEGFSNTFIQAWMRKVPVLSFNVNPDKLLDENGLGACANGNFERLVEQADAFITDAELRNRVGEKARDYANKFHSENNIARLVELF